MSRRRLVIVAILMITIIASAGGGYVAAWARGYMRMNESHAVTHSDMLFLLSRSIVRNIDTSGLTGLVDAIESNCDSWGAIASSYQPYSTAENRKRISRALDEWKTAKERLDTLRSSLEASGDPNVE